MSLGKRIKRRWVSVRDEVKQGFKDGGRTFRRIGVAIGGRQEPEAEEKVENRRAIQPITLSAMMRERCGGRYDELMGATVEEKRQRQAN